MKPRIVGLLTLFSLILLSGCATSSLYTSPKPTTVADTGWAVPALVNNTATPYAGARAQQMLAALLVSHGVHQVRLPPPASDNAALPLHNGEAEQAAALAWARTQHLRYALLGSVDEWRYKVGLDGQPAVGFTLRLVDLENGHTLWSGTAAATGGSREGIAVLAQKTLNRLIDRLRPR
ncbi:hypothetical protein [Acidihalobacter prosperus]|uniref:Penicillin-binding protein activator LpoB n=1 Tax=Acidihalobacter prosperus TaxID=160660 RepID=A0A1A6C1R8_9GAMM|nr:hypothetical protein [Acidihalobacter prosperus]OBS08495.1 hypothetical protein Thpro_022745 [Acidihalobacter prosperus]